MNRRDFLTITSLTPFCTNELFATNNISKDTINKSIFISKDELITIAILRKRLRRLRRYIGFANFNILDFNSALFYGRNYPKIGAFTKNELILIDKLFYEDPSVYGFYGARTTLNIGNKIKKSTIKKIKRTGHFLFKGKPLSDYKRLKIDVGNNIILTSGIRNIVKQLSLYCDKIYRTNGNMSIAVSNIAPPAYSHHTTSDFDVGRKDWGYENFTAKFANTKEFKVIKKLKYVSTRYTKNNKDGVRYEPWHIEVI